MGWSFLLNPEIAKLFGLSLWNTPGVILSASAL
jgi:hypothetical protein